MKAIGRKGNGPGEYSRISDCTINHTDSLIYILDRETKNILTYKLPSGKFMAAIKLKNPNTLSRFIEYCNGKLYTDVDFYKPDEKEYMLREIDLESGEEVNTWLSNDEYNKGFTNR